MTDDWESQGIVCLSCGHEFGHAVRVCTLVEHSVNEHGEPPPDWLFDTPDVHNEWVMG